ncbi:Gldg family protein [Rubritalea spongiae]|uniref:Gldg family protein n=1 Tax=Rubritalea spongiae TaxID=430797 RepID=A0ABW5DZY6_9BACT
MKKISPMMRATLGIVALFLIVVLGSWLTRLTVVGNSGVDLTENKVHTLTEGTRSILKELDPETPVSVRFYATRESPLLSREQKLFIGKVDSLLKEYQSLAKGALRVEFIDPQPDTDAEDSARLDGIAGQRVMLDNQEENLYLGIAVECLDQKARIASVDVSRETMLEYDLSKAIAEVSRTDKPVLGLISGLPLTSAPAGMPGQAPQAPWIIHQALQQSYELQDLGSYPEEISPKEITTLLLLHPTGLSEKTEYAIDQYLLGGGSVVACIDPYCYTARRGMGASSSDLPNLLKAWGVQYDSGKVLFDLKHRTPLQGGMTSPVFLSLNGDAIVHREDLAVQGLNDLVMVMSGSLQGGDSELEVETLLRSSTESGMLASHEAGDIRGVSRSMYTNPVDSMAHGLAMRLSGNFKTAFPDGLAKEDVATDKNEASDADAGEDAPEVDDEEEVVQLKESSGKGSVTLIADADFLADPFAFQVSNMMGMQMVNPINGNSAFLLNILDQTMGSKHLIGARGRSSTRRPFTVVQEMEAEFERNVGQKIEEIQMKQNATLDKIRQLEAKRGQNGGFSLSQDSAKELESLNKEQVAYAKEIREMQKGLQRQKDALSGKIIQLTMLPIISLVLITGGFVWAIRKQNQLKKA